MALGRMQERKHSAVCTGQRPKCHESQAVQSHGLQKSVSVALQVGGQRLMQKLAVECFSCKAANGFTQRLIKASRINFSDGRSEFTIVIASL